MTSGNFSNIGIDLIWVDRSKRQRVELRDIPELAESVGRLGLIHPIVITKEYELIAGERRWTACKALGWTNIPVQFAEDLDEVTLHLIELEENVKRVDITWQEQSAAINKYHELRASGDEPWNMNDTADALGMSRKSVNEYIAVAKAIDDGNERVIAAPKFSVARGVVTRTNERKKDSAIAALDKIEIPEIVASEEEAEVKREAPILNEDFHQWAADYIGPKFNFIHCDFPYGVNADKHHQGAADAHGGYADDEGVYWDLVKTLAFSMDHVVADSAHLMFWFSMDYYQPTFDALTEMGWRVNPFPLIWLKSDNTGILPDANRGPRRIYETAFFASRGDRKVVQAVGNAVNHPGRTKEIHMSEKPRPMLNHFMRMTVDEYTTMLDPTCGSGNAVRVADALGASSVLGLERDPEFCRLAKGAYYDDERTS